MKSFITIAIKKTTRGLIPLVVLLFATNCAGQWTMVKDFGSPVLPYFINDSVGVAATTFSPAGGVPQEMKLWFTSDAGSTWLLAKIPTFIDDGGCLTIVFNHQLLGFAGFTDGKTLITSDTGKSWVFTNTFGGFFSVVDSVVYAPGAYSLDLGATWNLIGSNTIPGIPSVAANGSSCAMFFTPANPCFITYTTNRGTSWQVTGLGQAHESYGLYYRAFTQTAFRASERSTSNRHDSGFCQKTTNGGSTWMTVLNQAGAKHLSGGIQGYGCIVYVQRAHEEGIPSRGFLRSTDEGNTWKDVGGPESRYDTRFSVVGRGAVVYACDQNGVLWKTTNGGDGTLSSTPVRAETEFSFASASLTRDTLRLKLCDSASLNLFTRFNACDVIWLDSVYVQGFGGSVRTLLDHRVIRTGEPDTAKIVFIPASAGTYPVTIRAHIRREDRLTEDTTLSLVAIVSANPGTLRYSLHDTLDLGTQSLCSARQLAAAFDITVTGCTGVGYTGVALGGTSSTELLTVTPPAAATFAPDGKPHPVNVTFKPTRVGTEVWQLLVSRDGGVDTFYVRSTTIGNARSLSANKASVSAAACDSANFTLPISNTGCVTLLLDSARTTDEALNLVSALPLTLFAGSSEQLALRYKPSQAGSNQIGLHLYMRAAQPGDTTVFDTIIYITSTALPGQPLASLSRSVLNFGEVSTCGDSVMSFVIYSVGCDTLRVSGASAAGDFSGSVAASTFADSAVYTIRFAPSNQGPVSQRLVIQTNAGPLEVLLQGVGIASSAAMLSAASLSLEATAKCTSVRDTIFFANVGCGTLTIDSVRSSDNLVIAIAPLGPLNQGERRTITLNYTPTAEGISDAFVTIFYQSARGELLSKRLPVHLVSLGTPTVEVSIGAVVSSAEVGSSVVVPVIVDAVGKLGSGRELELSVSMNTDLLSPVAVSASNGWAVKSWSQSGGGAASGKTMMMTIYPTAEFMGKAEAAKITCSAFITDTVSTPIAIGALSSTGDCLTLSNGAAANFTLLPNCGQATLVDALGKKMPFDVRSVHPNPASTALTVELLRATKSAVRYELSDMRGTVISHGVLLGNIDVSRLSAGEYHLRISADGYVQTRKVVIER